MKYTHKHAQSQARTCTCTHLVARLRLSHARIAHAAGPAPLLSAAALLRLRNFLLLFDW